MSGAKRPVDYGAAPPHKKRRSPSTSSSSSSGRSSSTAGPARKESSGKHGRGAVGVLGDYYRTGEVAGNNRRWDTVIPDSQSPAPIPKQEDDIKPDPFFTYRSGSLTSTDSSAFGASGSPSSHSHSSEDVDIKPFPFERSRSLSTESKPSDDELGRSLNSGSSHSGDSSSRGSLDSDVKNFELDIKLEPGIEYRAPWLEERAQYAPRAVGVGPRPQPQPATIRSQPLSHFEADRSRSHAPSPVTETHVDVKDEAEDHTMATFDGMPPPRAPLSRATEMDMRRRERSVTNEHENDDYPEGDDESRSSRAGSTRSESAAQEERAYSIAAEGSQTSSPPRRQEEEEAQWREGSEDAVEEDQGAVEIELEPRPEAIQSTISSPPSSPPDLNPSASRLASKTSSLARPPFTPPRTEFCPCPSHLSRALPFLRMLKMSRWTTTTLLPLRSNAILHPAPLPARPRHPLRLRPGHSRCPKQSWQRLEDSRRSPSSSPCSML
ncbi:hypothetical protein BCR35DRAFT_132531 [Leucosporidium creatinivorum]|uniref:Uncharacterized protein n=1 Tax=Leucosporidium creatinivorum TaxID=106004 RepID=A0A1Y2G2T2_9BASI|nr:hypothetical protein BCR35DRAFT_132531 [Leucosporidium creatinivorum]